MKQYSTHNYIRTFSGIRFPVFDVKPEHISIKDLICVLPRIPRFGGHTKRFYSVGEHLIHTRNLAVINGGSQNLVDACFLHDFSEIYLCDIPSPFKKELDTYNEMEENIQNAIYKKFNCPKLKDDVRSFDIAALFIEAHALMPCVEEDWGYSLAAQLPSDFKIGKFISKVKPPNFFIRNKISYLLQDICMRRKVEL